MPPEVEPKQEPKGLEAAKFNKTCHAFGCKAEENDGVVTIKKGDRDIMTVFGTEGAYRFQQIVGYPKTVQKNGVDVTINGPVFTPSDQEHLADHAATCARDLLAANPV